MAYTDAFKFLVDIGLLDVILPFLLVFTIFYAILQRSQILGVELDGTPKVKLNVMVAFVMGFLAVLATNLLNIINILLSYFVLVLVIGLLVALVFGLTGAETGDKNKLFKWLMIGLFFVAMLYALVKAGVIPQDLLFKYIILPVILLAIIAFMFRKTVVKEKVTKPEDEALKKEKEIKTKFAEIEKDKKKAEEAKKEAEKQKPQEEGSELIGVPRKMLEELMKGREQRGEAEGPPPQPGPETPTGPRDQGP